jgi:hypothetical protein
MKTLGFISTVALLAGLASSVSAQEHRDYCTAQPTRETRELGECSPNTQAPTTDSLVSTLRAGLNGGSDTAIQAALEYSERMDAARAVHPAVDLVLQSDNANTREVAAWWLGKRIFTSGWVARVFAETLGGDYSSEPAQRAISAGVSEDLLRARSAQGLGEFRAAGAFDVLRTAATSDSSAIVRESAVRALARTNHSQSGTVLATALADGDVAVRYAALSSIMNVSFFREGAAVVGALADTDARNRRQAALLVGHLREAGAVPVLVALLRSDEDASVRRAAAWALGRVGGGDASAALGEAIGIETDRQVLDAIEVAQQMR